MATVHTKKVQRLYRTALRTMRSHQYRSYRWPVYADLVRGAFERNRHETNVREIEGLIWDAEYLLYTFEHHDPLRVHTDPGGTSFMRNPVLQKQYLELDKPHNIFVG